MTTALVVVDVQNDFCEGGSLGVAGGAALAARVSELITSGDYQTIIATRDHHIDPGSHFSANPDYIDSWPPHCVAGTTGAELHEPLRNAMFAAIFDKGEYEAAYSGFEGKNSDGRSMEQWLRDNDITQIDVCGIATDHCVRATALDGAKAGFAVRVLSDLVAAVTPENIPSVVKELQAAGVAVTA